MSRSQRYFSKPLLRRFSETRATCELSIAWSLIPSSVQSKLASVTSSLTAESSEQGKSQDPEEQGRGEPARWEFDEPSRTCV
jgi:hypothetical protein